MNTSNKQLYYFDANALVKFFVQKSPNIKEKGIEVIQTLVEDSTMPIFVSELTLLECFSTILKFGRRSNNPKQSYLSRKQVKKTVHTINAGVHGANKGNFRLVPMPTNIYGQAETLLMNHYQHNLQVNDAIHLAIYQQLREKIPQEYELMLASSDKGMQAVAAKIDVLVFDAE